MQGGKSGNTSTITGVIQVRGVIHVKDVRVVIQSGKVRVVVYVKEVGVAILAEVRR